MSGLSLTLCSSISTPKTNNKKAEDYEPESLKVMMAPLDRHLRNKSYTLSIVRDREFSSSKEVLEDKVKQLHLAGRGKRPNKARQVSEEEEEIIWRSGKLEVITQKHIEQFHELFSPFLQLANFKNIEQNVVLTARVMIFEKFE